MATLAKARAKMEIHPRSGRRRKPGGCQPEGVSEEPVDRHHHRGDMSVAGSVCGWRVVVATARLGRHRRHGRGVLAEVRLLDLRRRLGRAAEEGAAAVVDLLEGGGLCPDDRLGRRPHRDGRCLGRLGDGKGA